MGRVYCVYILASSSGTLYTGVTSDLESRVLAHKHGKGSVFTRRYAVNRLVYYERFADVLEAIERETQVKDYRRPKKVALVESQNPKWKDLASGLGEPALMRTHRSG